MILNYAIPRWRKALKSRGPSNDGTMALRRAAKSHNPFPTPYKYLTRLYIDAVRIRLGNKNGG